MYGIKFILRAAWPQILLALCLSLGLTLVTYKTIHDGRVNQANRESAPCINFNETPIQEVPARCFGYFSEHK